MSAVLFDVEPGMPVVDAGGVRLGRVATVRDADVLVARDDPGRPVLYVPGQAVRGVEGGRVVLAVAAGEIASLGWEWPPSG